MRPATALVLLLAAGCLNITDTSYPVPVCANTYPDGAPKDCGKDQAVAVGAAPAQGLGWTCMAQDVQRHGAWSLRHELWRSDAGIWRLGVFGHGSSDADAVVTAVHLYGGGSAALASALVRTTADGWVELGPASGANKATLWTYAITIDGADAQVRVTDWHDVPWLVYADPGGRWAMDGNGLPGGSGRYVPEDLTFAVDGIIVTVDQETLEGKTLSFSQLAPTPGLGLPCGGGP